jgi:hypothetical protein
MELMGHWFEVMDTYKKKHIVPEKDYGKFSFVSSVR